MSYEEQGFLGSGDIYFDTYVNGAKTGEWDIGNAMLEIESPDVEKKEQTGYRRANFGKTIGSTIVKTEQSVKITMTDVNRANLVAATLGEDADYIQVAGNDTSAPKSIVARLDKYVKLDQRNLDPENPPVVKDSTETDTYVENTDYEIDYQVGRIKALSSGEIADEEVLKVGSTWLAITDGYQIDALKKEKVEVFVRMVGRDQANSRDCEVIIEKADIVLSGVLGWLTGELMELEITGDILATANGSWKSVFY